MVKTEMLAMIEVRVPHCLYSMHFVCALPSGCRASWLFPCRLTGGARALKMCNAVKIWIQLNIPRIEDGNNFGVSIQVRAPPLVPSR